MADEIGDGPIEEAYKAKMAAIARTLDEYLNEGKTGNDKTTGFVLLVFDFNTAEGRTNYMSNANREDVKAMLKQQLARFEGQPDVKGHA